MFGRKTTCDVLVVGAGPVGLFAALRLARLGVDVEIIDSQWRTAARSYALALHPHALVLLEELGLLEELLENGRRLEAVGFYDRGEHQALLDFSRLEGAHPYLLVTPQNVLEEGLENSLADAGVSVKWSHRLSGLDLQGKAVDATVQRLAKESTGYSVSSTEWVVDKTAAIQARFVLGADGCHSAVRRLAGIKFEHLPDTQEFAVFECSSDRDPGREMQVILEADRASVLWPLPGKKFRCSFEIEAAEGAGDRVKQRLAVQVGEQSYPYLSPESLRNFLRERAPWFEPEPREVQWSVGVRFDRRVAKEFGRDRVSLLGDAAHMAGPIGVQSMNSGFRDASELAELVAKFVLDDGERVAIDIFDRERAAAWQRLLEIGDDEKATNGSSDWIRQRADRIPECIPALGKDLAQLLAQLGLD